MTKFFKAELLKSKNLSIRKEEVFPIQLPMRFYSFWHFKDKKRFVSIPVFTMISDTTKMRVF